MAKIKASIRERDFGFKKIMREVRKLAAEKRPHVKIGVMGPKASEKKQVKTDGAKSSTLSGLTNVEVATFHEFGGEGGRPPERSFLRSTMTENASSYVELANKIKDEIFSAKMTSEKGLAIIGMKIVSDVKKNIRAGIKPDLAQSTINAKGSSTPLIDTGQMLNSITYAVDDGTGGEE